MHSFAFHQPSSVPDASALLDGVADSRLIAGGMTLLPVVKQRLAMPAALIDLSRVPGLKGCTRVGGVLTIGSMTRHVDVATSPVVGEAIPALARLATMIGDPAVRNRGTIGGSLANNDPAADYPAAAVALGATIVTDRREIPAGAFFLGLFETALAPGEIITAVRFPEPIEAGYAKMRNPASRYALVGVFVARTADGVRAAVIGAGPGVFRVPEMEAALAERFEPSSVEGIRVSPEGLFSDMHAEADYRAHLVTVMAKRAVADALGQPGA